MSQLKYFNPATQQWELALVGAQGEQGPLGPTGPEGPVGKYYVSELEPPLADSGDAWFETATGKFYIFYSGQWVENSSNRTGPMGPTGPQGVSLNIKGETLLSGLPNNNNLINDCYYVTDQNKLYAWDGDSWIIVATLPLGPTGPTGNTGPTGPEPTAGPMNYAQTIGTRQAGIDAPGSTIISVNITTTGKPVQVIVTGDVENTSAGAWTKLALYRGSTQVGNAVHTEASAGSENNPYTIAVIDAPAAGAHTYALKIVNSATAGGTFNWGESDGPVITAIELAGGVNQMGPTGSSGVVSVISPIINTGTSTAAQLDLDQSAIVIGQSQVTGLVSALTAKAPAASPTFSGTVTLPSNTIINYSILANPSTIGIGRIATLSEKGNVDTTNATTGTVHIDMFNWSVRYNTVAATGNFVLNMRGDGANTFAANMLTGDSATATFLNTNTASAYYMTGLTVDGTSVTVKWQGGTAPTAGNANAVDAYTITVTKTGSSTYTAFGSLTKFA